jgi:maleate cis-trans isomerase
METEFWRIAPAGVSVHSARISGGRHGTPEELRSMESASKDAARDVAMVEPDVVVYGCTSGSFFEGPEWNKKICAQLTDLTGAPTVTTAGAMAECLLAGGHKKVAVVTPYVELTNERLKDFLRAFGIRVTQLGTFDMLDMFDHAKILPEEIYRKVRDSDSDEAEALFVACTQLRALEVLDLLERDLGKPVYSAIQATAWQAFATLGIDPGIHDCGSLLRRLSEPGALKRSAPQPLQRSA